MKKIKVKEITEKKGLFGGKKTVIKDKTIKVDNKTYRQLKREAELKILEEVEILSSAFDE